MAQARSGGSRPRRVAVIGAGASGLAAAKCLLDEGLEPLVFERRAEIGGIWNFDEALPDGGGPAYRSLRTNTSRHVCGFSDFPFPDGLPDFPARADVLDYLWHYAARFVPPDRVRLGARVEAVTPLDGGRWAVRANRAGALETEPVDAVVVCTGLYHEPVVPTYPGRKTFAGEVTHSASYVGPEPFAGRDVVLVGAGSSAVDIALELCHGGARVTLSLRSGAWFVPRYVGRRPYDHQLTRLSNRVPAPIRMRVFRGLIVNEYRRLGLSRRASDWGVPVPPIDLDRFRFTVGAEVLPLIAAGELAVRPDVARLDTDDVVFSDGSRTRADALICCTGYGLDLPFLDPIGFRVEEEPDLYRYVFSPAHPGLAFVGMCVVPGPYLPVVEMQARWIARVVAGRVTLPAPAAMRRQMEAERAARRRKGTAPMRVQFVDYLDAIGHEIGVVPRPWRHPRLLVPLLFGPPTPSLYRLEGPGRWEGAPDAVRAAFRGQG
ncbi:MAG TPA: NAD(P)-binding domain-containing protein [Thermomicrobiaceae bacterium]|nr:NAD(P)-binding domain-containing protein [Thermomicrobiaceae bacterium]